MGGLAVNGRVKSPEHPHDVPGELEQEYSSLDVEYNVDAVSRGRVGHCASSTDHDDSYLNDAHGSVDSCQDTQVHSEEMLVFADIVSIVSVDHIAKQTEPGIKKISFYANNKLIKY